MTRPLISPTCIVFDLDGTLLDTERPYRDAFMASLLAHGLTLDEAGYRELIGRSSVERVPLLAARFGPALDVVRFLADYRERRETLAAHGVAMKPGASALLARLGARGIRVGVATSASFKTAAARMEASGLRPLVSTIATRDHVARGKPAPDVFLAAARALATNAEHCLAVEDSPIGAAAAIAAGMPTVLIPDLIAASTELRAACLAVLPDLMALDEALEPGKCSYVRNSNRAVRAPKLERPVRSGLIVGTT